MFKVAVVDDDAVILNNIAHLIECEFDKNQEVVNIQCFAKGEDFLVTNNFSSFDVVFLDIDLQTITGIDISKLLRENKYNGFIVFVTSHIEFSTLGYEVEAFRYILKTDLERGISECIRSIITKLESCFYPLGSCDVLLKKSDILYVTSDKHKVIIHLICGSSYSKYAKLDDVEKEIDSELFFRIHKSYLVNMKYVSSVKRGEAVLVSGGILPVSRRCFKAFEDELAIRSNIWV